MSIQIRLAVPADIPQLCKLRLAYFDEEFGTLPADKTAAIKAHLPAYFTAHLGRDCIAAAAEAEDGTLVSNALLTVIEKPANPFFPCGRSGYVLGVFTEPEYRGQGLATQIMTLILQEAKRLQLDTVTLSASDMGKPIYEKLGFTVKHSKFTEMEWFPE
ncbi:MAG: GNAT family N-acetyltransferase [Oscillospiraceae bacterium]|nr:GNAT family N-acetyltransferase [Oscillospiraceae bacterium]